MFAETHRFSMCLSSWKKGHSIDSGENVETNAQWVALSDGPGHSLSGVRLFTRSRNEQDRRQRRLCLKEERP